MLFTSGIEMWAGAGERWTFALPNLVNVKRV